MDNQNQSQDSLLQGSAPTKSFSIPTKYIIIFIVTLSVLSLGSTSYLLVANKKKQPPPKTVQENVVELPVSTPIPTEIVLKSTNTPTPTPILTVDPTATWSAFVSKKYSYSLNYPPDWTAKITAQTDPKILEYVVLNPAATKAGTLFITLSYGTRTYQEALALDPQKGETITVASVSATKKNQRDSGGNPSVNVIIPTGVNTIIINAKEIYKSILDKILTTIKLTQ